MSPEEDNATIKLNHMVHVVNMPSEFELYVLFRYFFLHVLTVNQDTTNEEIFLSLHGELHNDPCYGLQDLSWSMSSSSYLAQFQILGGCIRFK